MLNEAKMMPGNPLPTMTLPPVDGGETKLGGTRRWQVAVVYRGAHCPLCRKYLKAPDGLLGGFEKAGADVIAIPVISPQSGGTGSHR